MSAVPVKKDALAAGGTRPRLCVISDELDDDIDVALDLCEGLGVREVELRTLGGRNALLIDYDEFHAVVTHVRARGFDVPALATPVFKCALAGGATNVDAARHGGPVEGGREEHFALLEEAVERAATLEIPLVRIFTCWRTANPAQDLHEVVELVAEARRSVGQRPVELVVENEHDCIVATAGETRALLDRSPGLRVIWDPANHVRGGGPPAESVPRGWQQRIAHVHLKDVDASGRWVGLGTGLVPFAAVLQSVVRAGYDGAVSLETHCELAGSRIAATAAALGAIRDVLGGAP